MDSYPTSFCLGQQIICLESISSQSTRIVSPQHCLRVIQYWAHRAECLWAHNWNDMKNLFALILLLMVPSGQKFAHVTTALLLWHVQNCGLTRLLFLNFRAACIFASLYYPPMKPLWQRSKVALCHSKFSPKYTQWTQISFQKRQGTLEYDSYKNITAR